MTARHIALVAAAAAVAALIILPTWSSRSGQHAGWVEADSRFIGPEDGGRLASVAVAEGDVVTAGAPLFALDTALQRADSAAAAAALDQAAARLDRLTAAQDRPEEIAVLAASRTQAEAALRWSSADLERAGELLEKGNAPQSRYDEARSVFDRDQAALDQVNRQIAVANLPARAEDIAAARAAVAAAQATLQAARQREARASVTAPAAGRVTEVYYRPGEVVAAGRPVVALLPPAALKLRFFIPQAELSAYASGTRLVVSCDGCKPGLEATVSYLSDSAEFTPPVIYSLEERKKLVFRVEARPDDPAALRVGQPVTVAPAGGSHGG